MASGDQDAFTRPRDQYGEKYDEHVLDQYKLFVDTEERLVDRRQEENRFFLSVNSLLLAVLAFLIREGVDEKAAAVAVLGLGIAGVALCYAWYSIIDSYKTLNEAKFVVIDQFEARLPSRMFGAEWAAAEAKSYEPFTRLERQVPVIFGLLNIAAGLIGLGGLAGVINFS